MTLKQVCAQALGWLTLSLCVPAVVWAKPEGSMTASEAAALLTAPALDVSPEILPALKAPPARFEQAWDVVEVMGRPLAGGDRPARVVFKPQGGLWVDGGCNVFSGRVERGGQGQFRISQYTGTRKDCATPTRSEAVLNSALVMVNSYRLGEDLVLSSSDGDLVRLRPSSNQDVTSLESTRSTPTARTAAASGRQVASVKGKSRKGVKATAASKTSKKTSAATKRSNAKPAAAKKPR